MVDESKPPSSQWSASDGATARVRELLDISGALLERRIAAECHKFVGATDKKHGVRVTADSLTYGATSQEASLREIDQCVSLYKEFTVDKLTGVALHVQVPIEAKNRNDVQIFGIDYPPHSYRPRLPLTGFLQGSNLCSLVEPLVPFSEVPLLNPVLLEIKDGSQPLGLFKENVLNNAAGALYDFLSFDLERHEQDHDEEEALIKALIKRFEKYLSEKRYAWWSVLHDWMNLTFTEAIVAEFNQTFRSTGRVYYSINSWCPILCMNGPLWRYDGSKFFPCEALLTRVRVSGWPGKLRLSLIRYTTEAPLLLTNPAGLTGLLKQVAEWFLKIEREINAADNSVKNRCQLESTFYRAAIRHFMRLQRDESLRSDLDLFELM